MLSLVSKLRMVSHVVMQDIWLIGKILKSLTSSIFIVLFIFFIIISDSLSVRSNDIHLRAISQEIAQSSIIGNYLSTIAFKSPKDQWVDKPRIHSQTSMDIMSVLGSFEKAEETGLQDPKLSAYSNFTSTMGWVVSLYLGMIQVGDIWEMIPRLFRLSTKPWWLNPMIDLSTLQ